MEVETNDMRSPLSFYVGTGFDTISKSKSTCISHLQPAHLAILVRFLTATCLMAVVVHAIMPEDLFLEFKVGADCFFLARPLLCCEVSKISFEVSKIDASDSCL